MKRIITIMLGLAICLSPAIHAQKVKVKTGGGNNQVKIKTGGGNNQVKIKTGGGKDQVKIKTNVKGDKNKIDIKSNGNNIKFKGKGNWMKGKGDIYMIKGKPRGFKIKVFNKAFIRIDLNIGILFGFLGDLKIKLKTRGPNMSPARFNKLNADLNLLDGKLKNIEIRKNKIKIKLAKMK